MIVDLSLKNTALYDGCNIEEVAGRMNLLTPVAEAVQLVGRNIATIVANRPVEDRDTIVLTGPMAVWAYLVVFHACVHACRVVTYDDGRSGPVTIAKHG